MDISFLSETAWFSEPVPSQLVIQNCPGHRFYLELPLLPCYFSSLSHCYFSPPVPPRAQKLDSFTLKLRTSSKILPCLCPGICFPSLLAYKASDSFTEPGVFPQVTACRKHERSRWHHFHPLLLLSWLFLSKIPDLLCHEGLWSCWFSLWHS